MSASAALRRAAKTKHSLKCGQRSRVQRSDSAATSSHTSSVGAKESVERLPSVEVRAHAATASSSSRRSGSSSVPTAPIAWWSRARQT